MLNTESQSSAESPAAQTRIKNEELAKALAAIELRRQEQARLLEGTIVVGDAVQELQLDITPEEILAEVQAQREAEQQEQASSVPARHRWRPLVWVFGVVGFLAVVGGIIFETGDRPAPVQGQPDVRQFQSSGPAPDVSLIADIPNNMPFYCLPSEVEEVIEGTPLSQIAVVTGQDLRENPPWKMVKHNGQVYLYGWTSATPKALAAGDKNVLVYNFGGEKPAPVDFRPITLRLSALQYLGFYSRLDTPYMPANSQQEILSVADPHLDKYAWEKW